LHILDQHRLLVLYIAMKVTSARWWAMHKEKIKDWKQCRRLLQAIFGVGNEYIAHKYTGLIFPIEHVTQCIVAWRLIPKQEWKHLFIHTLHTIPKNWYLELEVHGETTDWEEITHNFKVTFSFEYEAPLVDTTLQDIKDTIFALEDSIELVHVCSAHRYFVMVREVLECYNVIGEYHEDEYLRDLQILETEGEYTVEGP
jgi:hypothetical protein